MREDGYQGVRCMCLQTACRAGPGCPHFTDHCRAHISHQQQVAAATLIIGGRYNWKHQPERLIYMGTRCYPGDRRTWHQFAKVEAPGVCWSEVLDVDLSSFEESTNA